MDIKCKLLMAYGCGSLRVGKILVSNAVAEICTKRAKIPRVCNFTCRSKIFLDDAPFSRNSSLKINQVDLINCRW